MVRRAAGAIMRPSPTALRRDRPRLSWFSFSVSASAPAAPVAWSGQRGAGWVAAMCAGLCVAKEQIGASVAILATKKPLVVVVNEVSRAERRCYHVGIRGVLFIACWQHFIEAGGGRAVASCPLAMAASAASHRGKTGLGRDQ